MNFSSSDFIIGVRFFFFSELIGNVILLLHTFFKYMERSTSWRVSFQITAAEQNGYGFLLSLQKLIADGTNYR